MVKFIVSLFFLFTLTVLPVLAIFFIRCIVIAIKVNFLIVKYRNEIYPIANKENLELFFDNGYKSETTQRPKVKLLMEWANRKNDSDDIQKQNDKKRLLKYCSKFDTINRLLKIMIIVIILLFVCYHFIL